MRIHRQRGEDWSDEARRYYFNIVGKFGNPVKSLLAKLSGLPLKSIRPLHGPILNDNLARYIDLYTTWCTYQPETEGIFIAVASIHGGTMQAARELERILNEKGASKIVVSDLCRSDFAENLENAFRYSKMVVAAASYDGGVFTPMDEFLHRLSGKAYSNRKVAIIENGSWAPSTARVMREQLSAMKNVEIVEPQVTILSRMKTSDITSLEQLADAIMH